MIRIVKNIGQVKSQFKPSECKYLLAVHIKGIGDVYAKPGVKPVIGYLIYLIHEAFKR